MAATRRGALIVFEGCDRSGKSTQCRLLTEYLKKRELPVKHLGFPARESYIGEVLDSYLSNKRELNDEAVHLLFAANRWEHMQTLRDHLISGTTVVVDRYSYSGIAYSVAKGLNYEWCAGPEKGLLQPDVVYYLKAPSEVLTERGKYGEERYEKLAFQRKVAAVFERISAQETNYWHVIDACQTIEDLHSALATKTVDLIAHVAEKPLKLLP